MRTYFTFLAFLALPVLIAAQDAETAAQKALEKLSFMEGQWSGSGWRMGPDGQKGTFNQTEDVQFKVNGEVMLVRGIGKTKNAEGREIVIHDALAMITHNPSSVANPLADPTGMMPSSRD